MANRRILFQLSGREMGGIETVLGNLLPHLKNWQIALCGNPGSGLATLSRLANRVFELNEQTNWKEIIVTFQPAIAVATSGPIMEWAAFCRSRKIPVLWLLGASPCSQPFELTALAHTLFDHILVPSDFVKRSLAIDSQVSILPNGIDCSLFQPDPKMRPTIRKSLGWEDHFIIGYCARAMPNKRHGDLVSALQILIKRVPSARLLFIGRTENKMAIEQYQRINEQISRHNLDDFVIQVSANPSQVPGLLGAMDAFAFPAISEGLGCSLLEAMAMELPTVVAKSGGSGELAEKSGCSLLVKPEDAQALAESLHQLWQNPALRTHLGSQARAYVLKNHEAKTVAGAYSRFFSSLSRSTKPKKPKVSVIIPFHNRKKYLRAAVLSCLAEKDPIEVIAVDDGSTDGSAQSIEDLPVRLFSHPSCRGEAAARNTGLKHCSADFVTFLDSDDLLCPEGISWRLRFLEQSTGDRAVVGAADCLIDENGNWLGPVDLHFKMPSNIPEKIDFCYLARHTRFHTTLSLYMFRRDLIQRTGLFDERLRLADDIDFLFRVLRIGDIPAFNKPVMRYRVHSENQSFSKTDARLAATKRTLGEMVLVRLSHGLSINKSDALTSL
ncbi:MAG: glycosyltransferase [Deltaproteobacteria bacterium]|nr:glycosyltransferase [Deltaproteobacteria bacterium]